MTAQPQRFPVTDGVRDSGRHVAGAPSVRRRSRYAGGLSGRRWIWKQRMAVACFLVAFRLRRVLRLARMRCGLAVGPSGHGSRPRAYWMAER